MLNKKVKIKHQQVNTDRKSKDNNKNDILEWINAHPMMLYFGVILLYSIFAIVSNWSIVIGENLMKWDIWDAEYPSQVLLTDAFADGKIPLWNPLMRYGTPVYSVIGTPVWYPFTLLLAYFGYTPSTIAVSYVMHIVIGGFGMFLLVLNELKCRDGLFGKAEFYASLISGIVFCGSGLFLSNAQHIMIIISAAWIPYVFYFFRCYIENRKIVLLMCAAGCSGLILLGGYPEMFYDMFLYLIPYVLFFSYKKNKKFIFNAITAAIRYIMFTLLTILSAAVILLPFLKNMGLITRGTGLGQIPLDSSFAVLLSLIFSGMAQITTDIDPSMINYYMGLITVLIIPSIFIFKSKNTKIYCGLALGALLLCLGEDSFLFPLFYRFLPMYASFRFPSLNRVFIVMFVLLAIGPALRGILNGQITSKSLCLVKILICFTGASAIIGALIGKLVKENTTLDVKKVACFSESAFISLILLVIYLGIFYAIYNKNLKGRTLSLALSLTVCVELLTFSSVETPLTIARYGKLQYSNSQYVQNAVEQEFIENENRNRETNFAGNVRSTNGLDSKTIVFNKTFDEEGYVSFLLSNTAKFMSTYRRSTMEQNPIAYFTNDIVTSEDVAYEEWANACDVPSEQIYVDEPKQISEESIQKFEPNIIEQTDYEVKYEDNAILLEGTLSATEEMTGRVRLFFENKSKGLIPLEISFFENDETFQTYQGNYELRQTDEDYYVDIFFPDVTKTYTKIKIKSKEMIPKSVSTVITERMIKDEYVSVNDFGFNSVYMTVDAPTEGYLTLLQANHDGWTAYVDGEEVDITLVNQCFMGVYLESGNHSVVFKFRPKEFFLGAVITGCFWILLVILCIRYIFPRRIKAFR